MAVSLLQLRAEFKAQINQWNKNLQAKNLTHQTKQEMEGWIAKIELFIQKKVQLLTKDFSEYVLEGEYLRSVTEGFSDLEHIMKSKTTFIDLSNNDNFPVCFSKANDYYSQYLIPISNILAKLDNDYIGISAKRMIDKSSEIAQLNALLTCLNAEKNSIRKNIFSDNRDRNLADILHYIHDVEHQKKILRLSLHHDQLNLFYFMHDRPPELESLKTSTDKSRRRLPKISKGITIASNTDILQIKNYSITLKAYQNKINECQKPIVCRDKKGFSNR